MDKPLTPKQYTALKKLTKDSKCFDSHDNCFQLSLRNLVDCSGLSYRTIQSLLRDMKHIGLVREVKDIYSHTRLMLSPAFYWDYEAPARSFANAMFHLGSHHAAVEWSETQQELGINIDPETGEVKGRFDHKAHNKYINSYGKNDRDKIHQRDGYIKRPAYATGEFGPTMEDVCDGVSSETLAKVDREVFDKWLESGEMDFSLYTTLFGSNEEDGHLSTDIIDYGLEEK